MSSIFRDRPLVAAALLGCALVTLATPALADRWSKAFRDGDRDALIRLARRAELEDLRKRFRSPDRLVQKAALTTAPSFPEPWLLLADLAAVAARPDRAMAVAAAVSAARIARDVHAAVPETREIPQDVLGLAAAAWVKVESNPGHYTDVRVLALETSMLLADIIDPELTLDPIRAAEPDPELRRAQLELVPQDKVAGAKALILERVNDADPVVAITAAAIWCAGLAHGGDRKATLGALGTARLRAIAKLSRTPDLPAPALLDAARCLASDPSAESRAALAHLERRAPRSIRARLHRLRRQRR